MAKSIKKENKVYTCCSPRQRFLGIVALGGLFVCGLAVGIIINGGASRNVKKIEMTVSQCESIASEIVYLGAHASNPDLERLRELNKIYSANCTGRVVEPVNVPTSETQQDEEPMETCELIENLFLGYIYSENTSNIDEHKANVDIYTKLVNFGCPENVEKYQALIAREQDILTALTNDEKSDENAQPCVEIERVLSATLPYADKYSNSDTRIDRAKIYANMSERGCPENSAKYVQLAKQELEIARALEDDEFNNSETIEVVETYKRLNMQAAAEEIFDKVKKLTNPAIDFIIEVEKIINE